MNLIRIALLAALVFVVLTMETNKSYLSISESHQNVSETIRKRNEIPLSHTLHIHFLQEGYESTKIYNNGDYVIDVWVSGPITETSIGQLHQIKCNLHCAVSSENGALHGSMHIRRTVTAFGTLKENELKDKLWESVKETIKHQIQNI